MVPERRDLLVEALLSPDGGQPGAGRALDDHGQRLTAIYESDAQARDVGGARLNVSRTSMEATSPQ